MSTMIGPTSFIVKVSGLCNLQCPYCYYFGDSSRPHQRSTDLHFVKEFLCQVGTLTDQVDLIWHGGEPLAIGVDEFERIMQMQNEMRQRNHIRFSNRIQTNGTLINDQWIAFFKKHDFGVGVSIDGPEWLNNRNRRFYSGQGSFRQIIAGVEKLQAGGIRFSTLSVVTKDSLGYEAEIFDFFVNQGIKRFDFLPCVEKHSSTDSHDGGLSDVSLNKGDFATFMNRIFDMWFARDDASISIRYLEEILIALLGGHPNLCKFNGSCKRFITINHDGDVLPCDNFIGYNELTFGNLAQDSLETILSNSKRLKFIDGVSVKRSECKHCRYLHICGGGCNRYSYMWKQTFRDENYFCDDRKKIFAHMIDVIQREHPELVLDVAVISRNAILG